MSKNDSLAREIYSGTATFGRWYTTFALVVASIVGVFFAGMGVYILTKKPKGSKSSDGMIFIVAGVVVVAIAALIYYLAHRFKPVAAVEGAAVSYNIFRAAI